MGPSQGHDLLSWCTHCVSTIFCVSVTHISWALICDRDAAEDEGIAVIFGGGARFPDALEQLAHGSVLPLSDKPLARAHVDRLGLQLKVLRQEEMTNTFKCKTTDQ